MIRVVISVCIFLLWTTAATAQGPSIPVVFGYGTMVLPKAKVVYGATEPVKYTYPTESLGFVETLFSKEGCGPRLGKFLFRCTAPTSRRK